MKPRNMRCMKFFLTFFNILSILCGLLVIAVCVVHMRDKKSKPEQQSAVSRGVLSFLITLALFLIVTAVLGCVGALRQHVRTLYVHACFFIFLLSIEVIVCIGAAVMSAWVGGSSELRVQFYRNSTIEEESWKQQTFWDELQSEYHCCGVDGPQDYSIIHREIPASCCVRAHPLREGGARRHLHATCLAERTYYMHGCEEILREIKAKHGNVFIFTGTIVFVMEIIIVVLSLYMARKIRAERRKLQQNLQAHFES